MVPPLLPGGTHRLEILLAVAIYLAISVLYLLVPVLTVTVIRDGREAIVDLLRAGRDGPSPRER